LTIQYVEIFKEFRGATGLSRPIEKNYKLFFISSKFYLANGVVYYSNTCGVWGL